MMLRRNHGSGLVKSLNRLLPVEFRRVKQQQRSVFRGVEECIEQPRRTPFARRDVLRGYRRCSLQKNQPIGKNTTEAISRYAEDSFRWKATSKALQGCHATIRDSEDGGLVR